jgi:signal transducing adaptor molecule
MHAELASRAFTDQLLRLVGDRVCLDDCAQGIAANVVQNTHATVKSKCLEKMAEWTEMFKNDPGLGIMEQAYSRVKSASAYHLSKDLLLDY